MVWSNWQGAVGRGALVVVLIWSGLAWTQTPAQRPGDPADRIMVVHENGRKIRCRVEETWQLPDGRVAHLLQALDTGEKITIVDDQAALLDPAVKNQKGTPKRIYAWGIGRKTPPEGSPIPPHLHSESGVGNTGKPGNVQQADFQKSATNELKIAQVGGTQAPGNLQIIHAGDPNDKTTPPIIQINDALPPVPAPGVPNVLPSIPAVPMTNVAPAPVVPNIVPGAPIAPMTNVTPAPGVPNIVPSTPAVPTINVTPAPAMPSTPAAPTVNVTPAPVAPTVNPSCCIDDSSMRRPWRPGDRVMDWLQNRNGPSVVTVVNPAPPIPGAVAQPVAPPSAVTESTGSVASGSNSIIDKTPDTTEKKPWRPGDRILNVFGGKSQTSSTTVETAKTPDTTKVDSVPPLPKSADTLKIQKIDDFLAQNNPAPEKKPQDKILKAPTGPFSTAMGAQPEVKKNDAPALPIAEKKDMWGVGAPDSVLLPGKAADNSKAPPVAQTRVNDPLTMPERFVDRRAGGLGPIGAGDMMPGDPSMSGYPLGSQSVLAARGGMLGQITYVPVPTVTVPQPFNPPLPPEPQMPSPPQLNTYVNAFTPPPQPKGTQEYSNQGMMPAQAMNPMMQYQMMMQQQAMYQQMLQQQAMNPNGYPPMVSQGPAMNFARQYQGPQAPNPVGPGPIMPAAYAPMPYPPMMPQQPVQQAAYQQPSAPAAQVDQLIKVLRESPYPAQREWAAQSLTSFEWRTHPHIVPNLLQSASQDPAASVRAGCVFCLGRMQAAVEPVFNTLNSMRNDIDPRVRQEVQQTLVRLGQTATAPNGN